MDVVTQAQEIAREIEKNPALYREAILNGINGHARSIIIPEIYALEDEVLSLQDKIALLEGEKEELEDSNRFLAGENARLRDTGGK